MSELHPHLRALTPEQALATRRRGPGAAVVLVLIYAGFFGAGLWWFRAKSPLFQRSSSASPSATRSRRGETATARGTDNRKSLGTGQGLVGAARAEYLRRIATDCCACRCDLTLERCLATEKTCPESPSRAAAILEELR